MAAILFLVQAEFFSDESGDNGGWTLVPRLESVMGRGHLVPLQPVQDGDTHHRTCNVTTPVSGWSKRG